MKSSNVLLIQKSIPPYREGLFNSCQFIDLAVHKSNENVLNTQLPIVKKIEGLYWVSVIPFLRILKGYSYVVLPGPDFTIVNLPLIHLLCRVMRIKLFYWTQGQNRTRISTMLSLPFWRMCDLCMVYSLRNAERLQLEGVEAVPLGNTIGYDEINLDTESEGRNSLIFVGRIVKNKNLIALVSWFNAIGHKHFDKLSIIGSGDFEKPLRCYIEDLPELVREKIIQINETRGNKLQDLLRSHSHYITSGKIGLGVVEALQFGLPILYDRNLYHSPEAEVLNPSNSMHIDFSSCDDFIVKPLIGAISDDLLPFYKHRHVVERLKRLFSE